MSVDMARMTPEDHERLGVDISLFQEGLIKPFKEHQILDKALYAKNQKKQARYTEEALLSSGTLYNHGHDTAVEVVHKGDTAPLLDASCQITSPTRSFMHLAIAAPSSEFSRQPKPTRTAGLRSASSTPIAMSRLPAT